MLDTACFEMYRLLSDQGEIYVDFGKPFKDKTIRQLGFFWGAIVDSVVDFWNARNIIIERRPAIVMPEKIQPAAASLIRTLP